MSIEEDIAQAILRRLTLTSPFGALRPDPTVVCEDGALEPVRDIVRALVTRALVAQGWMVAVTAWELTDVDGSDLKAFAALPAPADLAADLLETKGTS